MSLHRKPLGYSMTSACGATALALSLALSSALEWLSTRTVMEAGFWYDAAACELPAAVANAVGGPLDEAEVQAIKRLSLVELSRAFDGLAVAVTDNRRAFWRVVVRPSLEHRGPLPNAGEAYGLGPLGGSGSVSFRELALNALRHAPAQASREQVLEGIGRGIGRSAAHEFAHQMLGAAAPHDPEDIGSYEYPTSDRAEQFYGRLHWSVAAPLLEQKGRRR
ncbi:MAG: hypothetical protein U0Q12_16405 [Vicinamibacterales bacterium]